MNLAKQIEIENGIFTVDEQALKQDFALLPSNAEVASMANLRDPYYRRDKWDLRFLKLAEMVASWSKDPSTKTGAIIVRSDNSIASVGFNGFPNVMRDEPSLLEDREAKYSRMVHCEINAVLFTRESVKGYSLYTVPYASCDRCAVQMLQAGITRFIFPAIPEDKKERWDESMSKTKKYIEECGASWTEWNGGFKKESK